jgi:Bacterial PH domain
MPARTAAPPASQDREVLRLAGPVIMWWIWVVFVAANAIDFAAQGLSSPRFGAVVSAVLLFVTGLAYTLALRPRVITNGAGVTVLNPFRTHHVPWRLIKSVDTAEWVRIRYAASASTDQDSTAQDSTAQASAPPAPGGPDDGDDGTQTKTLHCWALYVSARARRKIALGTPRPRRSMFQIGGFGRAAAAAEATGYATAANSRLPAEARYLASLPVAKAMASRLDTRADRERARKTRPGREPDRVTASWAWPAIAAAVVPALILLIVALA